MASRPRVSSASGGGACIADTCGYGLDGAFEGLGRLWMPWRGKDFSRQAAEGVNLFTAGRAAHDPGGVPALP